MGGGEQQKGLWMNLHCSSCSPCHPSPRKACNTHTKKNSKLVSWVPSSTSPPKLLVWLIRCEGVHKSVSVSRETLILRFLELTSTMVLYKPCNPSFLGQINLRTIVLSQTMLFVVSLWDTLSILSKTDHTHKSPLLGGSQYTETLLPRFILASSKLTEQSWVSLSM